MTTSNTYQNRPSTPTWSAWIRVENVTRYVVGCTPCKWKDEFDNEAQASAARAGHDIFHRADSTINQPRFSPRPVTPTRYNRVYLDCSASAVGTPDHKKLVAALKWTYPGRAFAFSSAVEALETAKAKAAKDYGRGAWNGGTNMNKVVEHVPGSLPVLIITDGEFAITPANDGLLQWWCNRGEVTVMDIQECYDALQPETPVTPPITIFLPEHHMKIVEDLVQRQVPLAAKATWSKDPDERRQIGMEVHSQLVQAKKDVDAIARSVPLSNKGIFARLQATKDLMAILSSVLMYDVFEVPRSRQNV